MTTVKTETAWTLTQKLGDLVVQLWEEDGLTLVKAYRQSWTHGWDPTGKLEAIEDVLFLLGAQTLSTHCEDCAGLEDEDN